MMKKSSIQLGLTTGKKCFSSPLHLVVLRVDLDGLVGDGCLGSPASSLKRVGEDGLGVAVDQLVVVRRHNGDGEAGLNMKA